MFDALFAFIEDAPPSPVDKFPDEFVALIQRYNRTPTMGYFFMPIPTLRLPGSSVTSGCR